MTQPPASTGHFTMRRVTTPGRLQTAALRTLPDFLVIGAMKGGTTALFWMLAEHPCMAVPVRKELHFFDTYFHEGPKWYRSHFPLSVERPLARLRGRTWITGEATPYYLYHPHAAERAAAVVPSAKLIVVLRNPVDRAYSHYQMQARRGEESLSFEDALDAEEERLTPERERLAQEPNYYSDVHRRFSYRTRGCYAEQLRRWLAFFPKEQLLVLDNSELRHGVEGALRRTWSFLGLPPAEVPSVTERRVGDYAPMSLRTRERLEEQFAPLNQELYELVGRDLGWERGGTTQRPISTRTMPVLMATLMGALAPLAALLGGV